MIKELQWPRCGKCHKAVDVSPDASGRLWASCCGARVPVRLAFVPSDAKPLKLNAEKGRAS